MINNMDILFLSRSDVRSLINFDLAFEANKEAYRAYSLKWAVVPPILSLDLASWNGEIDIKSGYSGLHEMVGIKILSSYWDNIRSYNLPVSMGLICLFDCKNGQPLCILPANEITYFRSAAAAAYAATLLARPDSSHIALIGTGGLAKMQLQAIDSYFDISRVSIWGRSEERLAKFTEEMKGLLPGKEYIPCTDVREAVADADIISTATPSRKPLIMKDWVRPGTHINAFGADMPGKQELDPELVIASKLIVDDLEECSRRGESQHVIKSGLMEKYDIYSEIGQITLGKKPGRENGEEITVFDSVGISLQDISTVSRLYSDAREKGIGQIVQL